MFHFLKNLYISLGIPSLKGKQLWKDTSKFREGEHCIYFWECLGTRESAVTDEAGP